MTRTRKALHSAVVLGALLAAAELVCGLLVEEPESDPFSPRRITYPTMDAYLEELERVVAMPRMHGINADLLVRLGKKEPGSEWDAHHRSWRIAYDPKNLPADVPLVLIFGGSAPFGFNIPFEQTLGHHLELLLNAGRGRPLRVLNMGALGSEINTLSHRIPKVLSRLHTKPAAIVLLSGNNEFIEVIPRIGFRPWEALSIFQLARQVAERNRWFGPPDGLDFKNLFEVDFHPVSPAKMAASIRPSSWFIEDASFWSRIKALYLNNYRLRMEEVARLLAKQGILFVPVAPMINLHFFPGSAQQQPPTLRAVGRARRSHQILHPGQESDDGGTLRLARDEPRGPLPWGPRGLARGQLGPLPH